MKRTIDRTPHNPANATDLLPGFRLLTKCELPDILGKSNVPGLFFQVDTGGGVNWLSSSRVDDVATRITYCTNKPFGYYAPAAETSLKHDPGYRGLTALELATIRSKYDGVGRLPWLRRGKFSFGRGKYSFGVNEVSGWEHNEYHRESATRRTGVDPGPGCGTGGSISVPEDWDVDKDAVAWPGTPEVHNPGNIPEPGPGHRFLTEAEFEKLGAEFGIFGLRSRRDARIVPGLQFWNPLTDSWTYFFNSEVGCYADRILTHRVPNDWVMPGTEMGPAEESPAPAGCTCTPSVFGASASMGGLFAPASSTKETASEWAGKLAELQSRAENAEKEYTLLWDQLAKVKAREKALRVRVRESVIGESERALTEIRGILVTFGQSLAHPGVIQFGALDHVLNRVARTAGLPKSDVDFHFVVRNEPAK